MQYLILEKDFKLLKETLSGKDFYLEEIALITEIFDDISKQPVELLTEGEANIYKAVEKKTIDTKYKIYIGVSK